jgi:hypothetical protein
MVGEFRTRNPYAFPDHTDAKRLDGKEMEYRYPDRIGKCVMRRADLADTLRRREKGLQPRNAADLDKIRPDNVRNLAPNTALFFCRFA